MAVHTIRLREPWERSRDSTGELRLRRKFGLPTGLHASTRVVLAIGGLSGLTEVRVNGAEMVLEVASTDTLKWEITSLLKGRNEICLVVKASDETLSAGELKPLVRLEIEEREVEDR
jgi:hypothetical protein